MSITRRTIIAAACLAVAGPAFAQGEYPGSRVVTIVVPFAAGGTTDMLGRILADRLGARLGGRFIVENRAGAGGNTGVAAVARAPADGYTLTMGTVSTHAINPAVYSRLPFDHVKDFAPISQVASAPNILMVNVDLPAKSVPELIDLLKKNPGKYSFGSSGAGTSTHMAAEMFKVATGTDMAHVPYRSSGQVTQDLLSGQIQVSFDNITIAWPHVQEGKIRALATATPKRLEVAKDLPALAEFIPGYDASSWHGFFAPAGVPKEIVAKLSAETQAIMKEPAVIEQLRKLGVDPVGSSQDAFAAHIAAETTRWAEVAQKANVKIE
ncbi:tripartite tricarboxylate transporter substrate binding protein [Bosea sp. SSUT16]|uniref:Tripartite tricarboxylate transporter substrate binding protein n=1 Tax=Bosea spartocytisi TaxID=2773451 RepID=A0A927I1I0_9HYPH|nr:tripartite tricarboxylate transporter substrate binding protein [Bosea spartocytisi]MBD3848414.1 tripartite tricarboxylate transporter substrate binding protein [Bosea spartocytisi]MCT4472763.1 tripartite tricarboxylate transporter substrate binding protein [Bosea spartocytisi]